jgi:hypothetical protein
MMCQRASTQAAAVLGEHSSWAQQAMRGLLYTYKLWRPMLRWLSEAHWQQGLAGPLSLVFATGCSLLPCHTSRACSNKGTSQDL